MAIILGAAEGLSNREPARRLGARRPTGLLWRKRLRPAGLEGLLRHAPGPGRHKQIRQTTLAKILRMRLEERPREATHGSTRTLAERRCKRIRRGSFRGVRERERAIREYGAKHNRHARPLVWTASASRIIRNVRHCKQALVTGQ